MTQTDAMTIVIKNITLEIAAVIAVVRYEARHTFSPRVLDL
jgi:hypothetical protein